MNENNNYKRLGNTEHTCGFSICSCGVGRKLGCKQMSNHTHNNKVYLTWFLQGNGVFRQGEHEYSLHDNCVCLRRAEIPYTMELYDDAGPRLFIIMQTELFHFLCFLVPELVQMPPVWECPFSQEVFDAFFDLYDHMKQISSKEFYQLIAEMVRYILLVTGIQQQREMSPLEKGRQFLEDNQSLSLKEIAQKCGMPYSTFRRKFTENFGITPGQYRIQKRIDTAVQWLKQGVSVRETAEMLGYPDVYTFSHQFHSVKGISPGKYCSNMQNQD